jgi:hypothetical protein
LCGGLIISKEKNLVRNHRHYRPHNPQYTDYYRRVEDHFEAFLQVYEEHLSPIIHQGHDNSLISDPLYIMRLS